MLLGNTPALRSGIGAAADMSALHHHG